MWDEGDLDLVENPITQMTVINCLRRIGNNPITYDKYFHMKNHTFISEMKLNYVQYIYLSRDMEKLGV